MCGKMYSDATKGDFAAVEPIAQVLVTFFPLSRSVSTTWLSWLEKSIHVWANFWIIWRAGK